MNRYNAAALLAEKSAAVGITTDEDREVERLFEEVAEIWSQQKENESMRCVIRSYNRMITYFLKTSRTKFPDLRYVKTVSPLPPMNILYENIIWAFRISFISTRLKTLENVIRCSFPLSLLSRPCRLIISSFSYRRPFDDC